MNKIIQNGGTDKGESVQGKRKWLARWMMFLVMSGTWLVAYHTFSNNGERGATDVHSVAHDQTAALKGAESTRHKAKQAWELGPKNTGAQTQQRTASPAQTGGGMAQALRAFSPAMHYREAQALVDALAQSELDNSALTPEEINQQFAKLVKLGRAAIPAIRQYLQVPDDDEFGATSEEGRAAHRLLRTGFLKTLGQIEGYEADELLLDTLEITGDPSEVVQVSVQLERRDPGAYREQILTAAADSVKLAAQVRKEIQSNPDLKQEIADVAPVFELMRTLGDADLVRTLGEELMTKAPSWTVYSKIALAKLPEGGGIDALADMVVAPDGELAHRNLFALQMLAQESRDYPEAGEALVELATNYGTKIPARAWRKIAWALQGNQYELAPLDGAGKSGAEGTLGRVNIESLNLTYFKRSDDPVDWPRDQVAHRLALIDQLLVDDGSVITPEAVNALLRARAFIKSVI